MKICRIICFLCLSGSLWAQEVDVKNIALDLSFDWDKKQAFGTAEITLSPIVASNKITLDAGMLSIKSVKINDKALIYNYDGGEAKSNFEIVLDRIYTATEIITLSIDYHTNYVNQSDPNAIWGSFGKGLRFMAPTSTTPHKQKQVWSSGEPEGNKYWFPCHEAIDDIYTTDIKAAVPKPLMTISNGKLVETIDNEITRTFRYITEKPYPHYLTAIVIGDYADVVQGNVIHTYGYQQEKDAVRATTALLPDMMQFIEEKTACKYPYDKYTQVVVQDYPFPGLNGQNTLSILSDNYVDDYSVHQDFKYLWDGVAVQALTNQWFGNLLMPKNWEDIWLNNAFGQYFAGLYTIEDNSKSEYLTYIQPFEIGNVLADWNAGNIHPIVTNKYTDLNGFTTDSYSKYRGALVLRMLQKDMGDEKWWKAIRLYVKKYAHKQVNTSDFRTVIETISGKDYQWFFDQWVYKVGLPKLVVTKQYDAEHKKLNLLVKQVIDTIKTPDYEHVSYFTGTIEIEIDNKIIPITLQGKAENDYAFPLPTVPKFVNFNYENAWLSSTDFKQNETEYLAQLAYSKDITAKQKAIDALLLIAKDSATNSISRNKIIAAFKKEITSNAYWRYRQYALGALRKILPLPYDGETLELLIKLINTEKSWMKTAAIFALGNTKDEKYTDLYIKFLGDESDRVINAAAISLGKTKSTKAYNALMDLENKPSWKNQNRISALNGLEQLGDARATDYALKCLADKQAARWYLATPVWDYPYAAVGTLVALGKGSMAYPMLFQRFKASLNDNDLNDIFQNVQLIDLLKDERANEMYNLLKDKYKNDAKMMETINIYETQYLESIKK